MKFILMNGREYFMKDKKQENKKNNVSNCDYSDWVDKCNKSIEDATKQYLEERRDFLRKVKMVLGCKRK